ncbi:MAG: hypothetical protein PHC99_01620 [Methylococcales bacterium]|nr:hypothetical protein [Methylococcales bacterium]
MYNKKVLSAAILLILVKSALGIEVEPNNDSSKANPLGTENVGQLSSGGDVDFFSITNSCVKYTADDEKTDTSKVIKAGDCAKYTADDLNAVPPQKKGEIKYRSEISLAFSCNSRAAVGKGGWYLGLFDSNGVLQNTYQVQPSDCMVGASGSQGPYSFTFSTLLGDNTLKPDAKYYLSVVGDCHVPIYTIPQSSNPVIGLNTFVQSTSATKANIDAAKAEIAKAQPFLDFAIKALNDANFSVIGSNASIAQASDALLAAMDIANKAETDLAAGITTAVTTINAVSSTAKAVGIMADAMLISLQRHQLFNDADTATKIAAANITAELAKLAPSDTEVARLKTIKTNADDTKNAAATDDSDAKTKLGEANKALVDAVTVLNTTVNADIAAANAATAAGSRANNGCSTSNNATYTIRDAVVTRPYEDISHSSKLNQFDSFNVATGNTGNESDFDFFQINGTTGKDISLSFSCKQNTAQGSSSGWVASVWKHAQPDILVSNHQISPTDCSSTTPFSIQIKSPDTSTYYLGVQASCILPPKDTTSLLEYYKDSTGAGIACLPNTADFTIQKNTISVGSKTDFTNTVALGNEQTGHIDSVNKQIVYSVESDGENDIPLIFSCSPMAIRQAENWSISIYNDARSLVTSMPSNPISINGSDCGSGFTGDKGGKKLTLPHDSATYYLAVKSTCTTADCAVDTSNYNIARDVIKTYTGVLASAKTVTTKTANFKLTKCGANTNATIAIKAENVNLSKKLTPVRVQIGGVACQTSDPIIANSLSGTIESSSTILDSTVIAKDTVSAVLSGCGVAKGKVTLTGSGLDLVNLNPENRPDSVSIPIKVDFGDFHCGGTDTFYINENQTGDLVYTNTASVVPTPVPVTVPTPVSPPRGTFDPNWLTTKINLGATLQTGQINDVTDSKVYKVDTGTENANLTFSCNNSMRYQNDWELFIYDSAKTLKSTTIINGSSCAMGQSGDTGAYAISLTKDSPTYYLVVTSACDDASDKTCVDKSQYQLKRITATQAATNAATKPCFGTNCAAVTTPVKPFFK